MATALAKKPQPAVDTTSTSTPSRSTPFDPFMPPYAPGAYITDVSTTHSLLLNKYNVNAGHVLVITKVCVLYGGEDVGSKPSERRTKIFHQTSPAINQLIQNSIQMFLLHFYSLTQFPLLPQDFAPQQAPLTLTDMHAFWTVCSSHARHVW